MRKKVILGSIILIAALVVAVYLNRKQAVFKYNAPIGAEKISVSKEAKYYRVIEE